MRHFGARATSRQFHDFSNSLKRALNPRRALSESLEKLGITSPDGEKLPPRSTRALEARGHLNFALLPESELQDSSMISERSPNLGPSECEWIDTVPVEVAFATVSTGVAAGRPAGRPLCLKWFGD